MNVKIEIKLTNEDTKFSSSSTRRIADATLREVIYNLCLEVGSTLYALNPHTNEDALVLTEMSTFRMLQQLLDQK
jgi:hypothetical protein